MLIIVSHIVESRKRGLGTECEPLAAWVVVQLRPFDREDVLLAVLDRRFIRLDVGTTGRNHKFALLQAGKIVGQVIGRGIDETSHLLVLCSQFGVCS